MVIESLLIQLFGIIYDELIFKLKSYALFKYSELKEGRSPFILQ